MGISVKEQGQWRWTIQQLLLILHIVEMYLFEVADEGTLYLIMNGSWKGNKYEKALQDSNRWRPNQWASTLTTVLQLHPNVTAISKHAKHGALDRNEIATRENRISKWWNCYWNKKVYTRSGLISFPNKCFSCASEPLRDLFNTGKQIGFTQLKEIEQQKSLNFFTK